MNKYASLYPLHQNTFAPLSIIAKNMMHLKQLEQPPSPLLNGKHKLHLHYSLNLSETQNKY